MSITDEITNKKEAFFVNLSLQTGRPKGLGDGMMRYSTAVGAKGPPSELMTQKEREQFIHAAVFAEILNPAQSGQDVSKDVDRLLSEYRKWYKANERA